MSPEEEIALEDITRLRNEVQRGRERLFHASLSVTLHGKDAASLREMTQRAKAHFAATLGKLDNLAFRQREGLLSTLPLALNAVAEWRSLDTSSIARLFPFSPRRTWTPAAAPSTASTWAPATSGQVRALFSHNGVNSFYRGQVLGSRRYRPLRSQNHPEQRGRHGIA